MTERARECAKCKNWQMYERDDADDPYWYACLKGHRQRYYHARPGLEITPASEVQIRDDQPAGYRRRCRDFEERKDGEGR